MSFTSLLDTIIDRPTFIIGPLPLRQQTLEVVYGYFKERPSWIRQTDLPSVWVLLVRILAPSTEHDEATSTETFSTIIMILSTLVRLRRDILTSALPHFASVLRLLLQALRQPRSQLGLKQSTMVMNQLPRWIACGQPLGLCAAQDLARLLEAITTKTVMRRQVPSEDAKAESLARPFSKHASTILKAYVDIVNDTLCVIPLDVRRALQPGLFALCGMTGYHNRDALMVSSLDTGGMAVLKSLWAEFEKQRYVGRG
ncbi:Urb2/Npa2 family-domain-containing protein [Flagelloscypha sp. PMI_526]|nr:Urb2/Npa2 family-domain-containing protein [Flagelloscypha sp. PMI_526]